MRNTDSLLFTGVPRVQCAEFVFGVTLTVGTWDKRLGFARRVTVRKNPSIAPSLVILRDFQMCLSETQISKEIFNK